MIKFADEFRIKNVKEMIDEMIEAKYTLLKDLSVQYELKEWYESIIVKTDTVLRA